MSKPPPGHLVGYARVSTTDQNPEAQIQALQTAGCHRVFTDQASGAHTTRPQLSAALEYVRGGDTLVVWRMDRLGRSMSHLIETVSALGQEGVQFRSLTEAIDTATSSGQLMFHITASFAQFERDLISERTKLGLEAARAEGRVGGRPPVMDTKKTTAAFSMRSHGMPISQIAETLEVSRASIRRALNRRNEAGLS